MAQGSAASVLFRAYALTGCGDYRDVALQTLAPLQTDISDGGASLIRGDVVFFEEVSAQPCHILNGHLFAAFAVWEACQFAHVSPKLHRLHERAVETLLRWLPLYDAQGWSYYQFAARDDDERDYAPILYHQAHIAQLYVYTAMTQREAFRSMAD